MLGAMDPVDRKTAATRFRRHIERSNALHAEYLRDASLYDAYDRFASWQLEYLLPYFADLHAVEGYGDAIDFIMSDLAGVGISHRDRDLERAASIINVTLPVQALNTLASAAELNARVLEINLAICRKLMAGGRLPGHITERAYFVACRDASSYQECVDMVMLLTNLGDTLKALVKVPLIGVTLRAMKGPAHATGFGALQEFLETGFRTFREIPDIDHFLEQIRLRMQDVFARIYNSALEQADTS